MNVKAKKSSYIDLKPWQVAERMHKRRAEAIDERNSRTKKEDRKFKRLAKKLKLAENNSKVLERGCR